MNLRNLAPRIIGVAMLAATASSTTTTSTTANLNPEVEHVICVERYTSFTSQEVLDQDFNLQSTTLFLELLNTLGHDITDASIVEAKLATEYGEANIVPGVPTYEKVWNGSGYDTVCSLTTMVYINRSTDPNPVKVIIKELVILK